METLADLKRRCTPGTVLEIRRLKFKPATYFAVVADQKPREFGLVTPDRAQIGYTEWGKTRNWQFTEGTAIRFSQDDEPEALLSLRFLSEAELEALPEDVKALRQRYQPEAETTDGEDDSEPAKAATVTPEGGAEAGSATVEWPEMKTLTFETVIVTVEDEALTDDCHQKATETLEHHRPYTPATQEQRAAHRRPIAETVAEPAQALTEEQFWEAQKTVHQCLLELSEAAPPREAFYTVSTIRFNGYPQIEVRDVQVNVNGDWQAILVVHQLDALWLYELFGDLSTYHPKRLSLAAATEKRLRRVLDSAKAPPGLKAVLKGIQQLPTEALQAQALLLLNENTLLYLTRLGQKPLLIDLARWLQNLEIVVEPQRVQTTDGFVLSRQADGSYSDGDLTYESLHDLDNHHDWEEC